MKQFFTATLLLSMVMIFSGCEVIGDIFKAGVWVGVLAVVGILALIIFIFNKVSKK